MKKRRFLPFPCIWTRAISFQISWPFNLLSILAEYNLIICLNGPVFFRIFQLRIFFRRKILIRILHIRRNTDLIYFCTV